MRSSQGHFYDLTNQIPVHISMIQPIRLQYTCCHSLQALLCPTHKSRGAVLCIHQPGHMAAHSLRQEIGPTTGGNVKRGAVGQQGWRFSGSLSIEPVPNLDTDHPPLNFLNWFTVALSRVYPCLLRGLSQLLSPESCCPASCCFQFHKASLETHYLIFNKPDVHV